MDFQSLLTVEDGSVELLELTWPLPGPDAIDGPEGAECLCYAVMRRPAGILLCLPASFIPEEALLRGQAAGADDLLGPSTVLSVPPVQLSEEGEWTRPADRSPIRALVLDLSEAVLPSLLRADLLLTEAVGFDMARPGTYPLASEVLRQSRLWLPGLAGEVLENRSGYQTAVSEGPGAAAPKIPPKAKRPTVAQLALQQEVFAKALEGIANQLTVLTSQQRPGPGGSASSAPPYGSPSAWGSCVKPPAECNRCPPVTARFVGSSACSASAAKGSCCGRGRPAASYWFSLRRSRCSRAQRRLIFGGGYACAKQGSVSLGGTAGPELRPLGSRSCCLQQLGSYHPGYKCPATAPSRAISPGRVFCKEASPGCPEENLSFFWQRGHRKLDDSLLRAFRFGSQKLLGLLQYQLAQISDLLASNCVLGAADLNGSGYHHGRPGLFSLQPDPPSAVFVNHSSLPTAALRPFSPLADARLIASTLAYVKELETLSSRRLEFGPPAKKAPQPTPAPPGPVPQGDVPLSKKQQRARAWAAKKGHEGS